MLSITSKMTTALLKKLRVKMVDWPSMPQTQTLLSICRASSNGRNIHQLSDVVMEEWKRTPVATCEALVNSMPKRVKAVLDTLGQIWTFSLRGDFTSVASGLYNNGCVEIL